MVAISSSVAFRSVFIQVDNILFASLIAFCKFKRFCCFWGILIIE